MFWFCFFQRPPYGLWVQGCPHTACLGSEHCGLGPECQGRSPQSPDGAPPPLPAPRGRAAGLLPFAVFPLAAVAWRGSFRAVSSLRGWRSLWPQEGSLPEDSPGTPAQAFPFSTEVTDALSQTSVWRLDGTGCWRRTWVTGLCLIGSSLCHPPGWIQGLEGRTVTGGEF